MNHVVFDWRAMVDFTATPGQTGSSALRRKPTHLGPFSLVRRRTAGREKLYRIDASRLRQVHDWVSHFEHYWDEKLEALGNYLNKRKKNTN